MCFGEELRLWLCGESCCGGVRCGGEFPSLRELRRVRGDGGVGLLRRGDTGELPGEGEGLDAMREGLDERLREFSREFLLKRPTLCRINKLSDRYEQLVTDKEVKVLREAN